MFKVRGAVRMAAILIFAATLLLLVAAMQKRLIFSGGESYRFYIGDTSANCREIYSSSEAAPILRLTLSDLSGECAAYSRLNTEEFLRSVNGEIVFTEEVDGAVNYYCRADLPYSITLYGEEINLHICVTDERVLVGSPIIFGGY